MRFIITVLQHYRNIAQPYLTRKYWVPTLITINIMVILQLNKVKKQITFAMPAAVPGKTMSCTYV